MSLRRADRWVETRHLRHLIPRTNLLFVVFFFFQTPDADGENAQSYGGGDNSSGLETQPRPETGAWLNDPDSVSPDEDL